MTADIFFQPGTVNMCLDFSTDDLAEIFADWFHGEYAEHPEVVEFSVLCGPADRTRFMACMTRALDIEQIA